MYYFPGLHFAESPGHPILTPGVGKQFVYKFQTSRTTGSFAPDDQIHPKNQAGTARAT